MIAGTGVEIIGGDNAWEASDSGSTGTTTVTIEAGKIAGSANTVSLKGATSGQSITVLAGKTLTIGGNTEIALGGSDSKIGSIVLKNGATPAVIAFEAAGAKISTGNTASAKVTDDIAGGIIANGGVVGAKLEVYSSTATGDDLKLGHITPASGATFDGTDNVITGPTSTADTSIDGTLTVTAASV